MEIQKIKFLFYHIKFDDFLTESILHEAESIAIKRVIDYYFTIYNQNCSEAKYNCKIRQNHYKCILSMKLIKKDNHIYKIARMEEVLYKNLNRGHWADLVKT